jgi:hypothetical protein
VIKLNKKLIKHIQNRLDEIVDITATMSLNRSGRYVITEVGANGRIDRIVDRESWLQFIIDSATDDICNLMQEIEDKTGVECDRDEQSDL